MRFFIGFNLIHGMLSFIFIRFQIETIFKHYRHHIARAYLNHWMVLLCTFDVIGRQGISSFGCTAIGCKGSNLT